MVNYGGFPIDVLTVDGAYAIQVPQYDEADQTFHYVSVAVGLVEYGPSFNNEEGNWTGLYQMLMYGASEFDDLYDLASAVSFKMKGTFIQPFKECSLVTIELTKAPANINKWYGSSGFGIYGVLAGGSLGESVGDTHFWNWTTQTFVLQGSGHDGFNYALKPGVEAIATCYKKIDLPPVLGPNGTTFDWKPLKPSSD